MFLGLQSLLHSRALPSRYKRWSNKVWNLKIHSGSVAIAIIKSYQQYNGMKFSYWLYFQS